MSSDHHPINDPRRALQFGLGITSPLWSTFVAAASAGVAFWMWSQWSRRELQPQNAGAPAAPGSVDVAAPPPANDQTPAAPAELAQPAPEPKTQPAAAELAPVLAAPAAEQLTESLAVQAAPPANEPPPTPEAEASAAPEAASAPEVAPEPLAAQAPAEPPQPPRARKPASSRARSGAAVIEAPVAETEPHHGHRAEMLASAAASAVPEVAPKPQRPRTKAGEGGPPVVPSRKRKAPAVSG